MLALAWLGAVFLLLACAVAASELRGRGRSNTTARLERTKSERRMIRIMQKHGGRRFRILPSPERGIRQYKRPS